MRAGNRARQHGPAHPGSPRTKPSGGGGWCLARAARGSHPLRFARQVARTETFDRAHLKIPVKRGLGEAGARPASSHWPVGRAAGSHAPGQRVAELGTQKTLAKPVRRNRPAARCRPTADFRAAKSSGSPLDLVDDAVGRSATKPRGSACGRQRDVVVEAEVGGSAATARALAGGRPCPTAGLGGLGRLVCRLGLRPGAAPQSGDGAGLNGTPV